MEVHETVRILAATKAARLFIPIHKVYNSQFFLINPILVQPIFAKQPQPSVPLTPPPKKKPITLNKNLKALVLAADIKTDISHPYDIDFGVMSDLYFMVQ